MSEIKTVRIRSGEGALAAAICPPSKSVQTGRTFAVFYDRSMTRERRFVYKRRTYAWNIAWNTKISTWISLKCLGVELQTDSRSRGPSGHRPRNPARSGSFAGAECSHPPYAHPAHDRPPRRARAAD